jgi:probable F420-dependent oxidoreductase
MKIGTIFPTTEIGNDVGLIKDYLQTVEGLGFSHILMLDHVLGIEPGEGKLVGPYTYKHAFHEPMTFMAWAAGVTTTLEFATGILILPQRQTALVAKQAAEIDVLSGGRLKLGVAAGWNKPEYDALGEDFGTRGRKLDAQIPLLRELWSQDLVHVRDRWHNIDGAGINPRPARQIPIWLGGMSEAAMLRAARLGDGWIPYFLPDDESGELRTARRSGHASDDDRKGKRPVIGAMAYEGGERAQDVLERLRRMREDAGRGEAPFIIHGGMAIGKRTPEDAVQWTARWQAAGMDYFTADTMNAGLAPAEHVQVLRRYREALPEDYQHLT